MSVWYKALAAHATLPSNCRSCNYKTDYPRFTDVSTTKRWNGSKLWAQSMKVRLTTPFATLPSLTPPLALRQVTEIEKSKKTMDDLKKSLKSADRQVKDLEAQIEQEGQTSSETGLLQRRLIEELEEAIEQHQKDLAERNLMIEQTRTTYQGKVEAHMTSYSCDISFSLSQS